MILEQEAGTTPNKVVRGSLTFFVDEPLLMKGWIPKIFSIRILSHLDYKESLHILYITEVIIICRDFLKKGGAGILNQTDLYSFTGTAFPKKKAMKIIDPSVYADNKMIGDKVSHLQKSFEYGMITYEQMLTEIKKMEDERRQIVDQIHPYAITKVSDTYGKDKKQYFRWITRVPDSTRKSGTRKIQANTEEKVYEKLLVFYGLLENKEPDAVHPLSLAGLYEPWIKYRLARVSVGTVKKDKATWNRYYEGDDITRIPLPGLKPSQIFMWMSNMVSSRNLTKRQYTEMRGVWNMIEGFAYNDDLLSHRTVKDLEHPERSRFREEKQRFREEETFSSEELLQLIEAAHELYRKSHFNTAYLGLIFEINVGFRVGELSCLRWDNIDFENKTVTIRESEKPNYRVSGSAIRNSGYEVMNHLKKGHRERTVPLPPEAEEGLYFIRKEYEARHLVSDYVFIQKNGNRVHTRAFHKAQKRIYSFLGWTDKKAGVHEFRRTYATSLIDGKVDDKAVQTWMGHKDWSTTKKYYQYTNQIPDAAAAQAVSAAIWHR